MPTRSPIRGKDIAEIVIGSFMLAAPVSVTEEVWNLSEASFAATVVDSIG